MNSPIMKSKNILILLLSIFIVSCNVYQPEHLSGFKNYGSSPYGCNINMKLIDHSRVSGELIYSDKDYCYIKCDNKLNKSTEATLCTGVVKVSYRDIHKGYITLFNSELNSATLPIFTALSLGHGLLAIGSFPVNLTGAILGLSHSKNHASLSKINIESLVAYSRFPNGIPEGVDIFTDL